jgi:hypothetical protein
MLIIVRIHSKGPIEPVWDEIVKQQEAMQKAFADKCHILYLTKRQGFHKEANLFVEVSDHSILSDLLVFHLAKIKDVENFVVHHLLKPKFYPLPRDTKEYKRFVINLKVEAPYLADVYKRLVDPNLPEGMKKVYFAFAFHHWSDCIQFSLLSKSEEVLRQYVAEVIDRMPGVARTSVVLVERSKPFISYETWQSFAEQNPSAITWGRLRGHTS